MSEDSKTEDTDTCHVLGHGELSVPEAARLLLSTDHIDRDQLQVEFLDKMTNLGYTTSFPEMLYELPQIRVSDVSGLGCSYLFDPLKILGGGSYGIVVRYKAQDIENFYWVVKIERLSQSTSIEGVSAVEPSDETNLINMLNKRDIRCGQMGAWSLGQYRIRIEDLSSKKVEVDWADFNLLEPMSGDLSKKNILGLREVIEKYTKGDKTKDVVAALCIIEEVRKQILCLLKETENSAVYTDLKAANVLFTETTEGKLEIKVGDLGSMTTIDNNYYIATYPCFPHAEGVFPLNTREEKEQCLSWELGVLLANLLGINIAHLSFVSFQNTIGNSYLTKQLLKRLKGIREQMVTKLSTIMSKRNAKVISSLLSPKPSKRPSLTNSLVQFSDVVCSGIANIS
jgi:hypothetical protein